MSVPQIMPPRAIICSVPDERRRRGAQHCGRAVTADVPAQVAGHAACSLYLDRLLQSY